MIYYAANGNNEYMCIGMDIPGHCFTFCYSLYDVARRQRVSDLQILALVVKLNIVDQNMQRISDIDFMQMLIEKVNLPRYIEGGAKIINGLTYIEYSAIVLMNDAPALLMIDNADEVHRRDRERRQELRERERALERDQERERERQQARIHDENMEKRIELIMNQIKDGELTEEEGMIRLNEEFRGRT